MPSLSEIKKQIHESTVLDFGQYKNLFVSDVLEENPSYILWLGEQDWCSVSQKLILRAQELIDERNGAIDFSDTPWNPFD